MDSNDSEQDREHQDSVTGIFPILAGLFFIYLGFFVMLLLDELVWKTRYLDRYINGSFRDFLFVIYYPLILLVRMFLKIP